MASPCADIFARGVVVATLGSRERPERPVASRSFDSAPTRVRDTVQSTHIPVERRVCGPSSVRLVSRSEGAHAGCALSQIFQPFHITGCRAAAGSASALRLRSPRSRRPQRALATTAVCPVRIEHGAVSKDKGFERPSVKASLQSSGPKTADLTLSGLRLAGRVHARRWTA